MTFARFHLPDGEIAFYEWGTYAINLAPFVGLDKDTIPLILDRVANRRAFWSGDGKFRGAKASSALHRSSLFAMRP